MIDLDLIKSIVLYEQFIFFKSSLLQISIHSKLDYRHSLIHSFQTLLENSEIASVSYSTNSLNLFTALVILYFKGPSYQGNQRFSRAFSLSPQLNQQLSTKVNTIPIHFRQHSWSNSSDSNKRMNT